MNKDRIFELAAEEAEDLWGPLASCEIKVVKVSPLERFKLGVSRLIYTAETEVTYELKVGRFRRPSPQK